jgi:hypothetical protein
MAADQIRCFVHGDTGIMIPSQLFLYTSPFVPVLSVQHLQYIRQELAPQSKVHVHWQGAAVQHMIVT